jgi:ubiquinone/menaquinone biosynthesis C-methylase UbiE
MAGPSTSRVALEVVGVRRARLDSGGVEQRAPSPAETWDEFFGEFYLRAYLEAERNAEAEAQALAAAKLAGCPPGGDLLDVPCGFGRHALPLATQGFRVVGVDRAQALLDEARRRKGHGRWPKFVRADYRDLPLPDESFDTALNLFSSLGYLGDEEDTRALAEIRRVLRPGGRLLIEILHRDRIVRHFAEQDWHLLGEGRLLLEQRTFDPISGVAQTTQTLIESAGARESRTFSIRVYTATELLAMLAEAGFEEARCHGDLQGGPFSTDSRLVVVAHR